MSSYFELRWRDDQFDQYDTDKLNFIYNVINHPLDIRYRQDYDSELEWRQAIKKHEKTIADLKKIINNRPDAHQVRDIWLKQHKLEKAEAKHGKTNEELAEAFPYLANQLGAYIEIENIEVKYFDDDLQPRYDIDDFRDVFPENYPDSGFKKHGMTKEALLNLYPQIKMADLDKVLAKAGYESETENGLEIMSYWYAVNAKRMLVDGDSFDETFAA